MTEMDYKLNLQIMQEMGLEEGDRRRVIEQDTKEIMCLGTKDLVTPKSQTGRNAIEFDPINNPRMMTMLFMEFVDRLAETGDLDSECISFGAYEDKKSGKLQGKATFMDGTSITSGFYDNEPLCYYDLVRKLNGNDDGEDLSQYDVPREKPTGTMRDTRQTDNKKKRGK